MPVLVDRQGGLALGSTPGRWVLAVSVLGSGMAFLDGTVVNVALPTIGRDLGLSAGGLQWILNGYLLTLASLILLGGSLGDRYGRRRVFVLGVGVFTAASLLCALAPGAGLLITARLLQGAGGALLTPTSLAMLEASFRPADRARAIGAWSGLTGVAAAVGPLLGGYLVDVGSWRAVFLINLPLGVLAAGAAHRHVPESRDPSTAGALDVPGPVLAALGLGGITYALIEASSAGASPTVVTSATVGAVALIAFVVSEGSRPNPMLPLAMFASRRFSGANGVTFMVYAAVGGVFFLLVSFLQIALAYSAVAAGAATLPVTVLMLVFSTRSGTLAQRVGPRFPLAVGPMVIAAGLVLMARISPGDSYVSSVLPAVVVFGVGLTLVAGPVTATVLAAVDAGHVGIASGINNTVARVGGLLAVATLPLVAGLTGEAFYDPDTMAGGFGSAMTVCAVLAAAGGVIALATIHGPLVEVGPGSPRRPMVVANRLACAINGPPLTPQTAARPRDPSALQSNEGRILPDEQPPERRT